MSTNTNSSIAIDPQREREIRDFYIRYKAEHGDVGMPQDKSILGWALETSVKTHGSLIRSAFAQIADFAKGANSISKTRPFGALDQYLKTIFGEDGGISPRDLVASSRNSDRPLAFLSGKNPYVACDAFKFLKQHWAGSDGHLTDWFSVEEMDQPITDSSGLALAQFAIGNNVDDDLFGKDVWQYIHKRDGDEGLEKLQNLLVRFAPTSEYYEKIFAATAERADTIKNSGGSPQGRIEDLKDAYDLANSQKESLDRFGSRISTTLHGLHEFRTACQINVAALAANEETHPVSPYTEPVELISSPSR